MICPTCERETAAVAELGEMGGGRMRKRCAHPDCKAALPEEKQAPRAVDTFVVPGIATPEHVERVVRQTQAPKTANGAPPSLAQTLAAFEERLPYVRDRIAELRAYEAEEKQIVLILTAAGKAPKEVKPS